MRSFPIIGAASFVTLSWLGHPWQESVGTDRMPQPYKVEGRWKEQLVYAEGEREFVFDCGWGATPPVAYVPSAVIWNQVTPLWMRDRRAEIVQRLAADGGHRLEDTEVGYPPSADVSALPRKRWWSLGVKSLSAGSEPR